jgi:predicted SAM-dependent methyltransferase
VVKKITQQNCRKLNIGCGHDKREGYLNIDVDPACSPDVLIVDGDYSMIPRRHFEEVVAKDVLEHIAREGSLLALIEWADYLIDGGKLSVQTSSILDIAAKFQMSTTYDEHRNWTTCLFGTQAHPGDFHYTGFTAVTLKVHMLAAGFKIDRLELRDGWMWYVEATKTEDWTATCDVERGTDAEFLQSACQAALSRDVADRDLKHWGPALKQGAPRREIFQRIYGSPERLLRVAERHGL